MSGLWDAAQLWPCVNVTESCDFRKRSLVGLWVGQHKQYRNEQAQSDAMSYFQYDPFFLFQLWHFSTLTVLVFSVFVSTLCLELRLVRHHCHLHLAASASQVYHQSDTNTNTVNPTTHHCPTCLETPCCTTVSGFDRAPHMYGVSKRLDFLGSGVGLYMIA